MFRNPNAARTVFQTATTPMNQKTTLIAAAVILLGGVGAIALMNRKSGDADAANNDGKIPPRREGTGVSSDLAPTDTAKASTRTERQSRDSDLVEKYGEARTNLSRHVVDNVVSLLDDAVGAQRLRLVAGVASDVRVCSLQRESPVVVESGCDRERLFLTVTARAVVTEGAVVDVVVACDARL